jgi:WD40 repeat protein
VQTWDLDVPRILASANFHAGYLSSVALTPEGGTAVSTSVDGAVRLWDPAQPSEVDEEPYAALPLSLSWNVPGTEVTTVDVYGAVRTWRIGSGPGASPRTFMTCEWFCNAAAVRPEADLVATVDYAGGVEIWPLTTAPRRIRRLEVDSASTCAWVGDTLVVGTSTGMLCAWAPREGRELWSRALADAPTVLATLGRDGTVVAGGRSGRVTAVDATTGLGHELTSMDDVMAGDDDAVVCAVVKGADVVVGTASGRVRCWSRHGPDWVPRWSRKGHDGLVLDVGAAPEPYVAATVGSDGRLCLWPADGGAPTRIDAHEAPARHLSVGARGSLVVTTGEDKRALVWSLPDGRLVGELPLVGDGQAVAVHPTAGLIACCDTSTGVYVARPRSVRGSRS